MVGNLLRHLGQGHPLDWTPESIRRIFGVNSVLLNIASIPSAETLAQWNAAMAGSGQEAINRLVEFSKPVSLGRPQFSSRLGASLSETEAARLIRRLCGALRMAGWHSMWLSRQKAPREELDLNTAPGDYAVHLRDALLCWLGISGTDAASSANTAVDAVIASSWQKVVAARFSSQTLLAAPDIAHAWIDNVFVSLLPGAPSLVEAWDYIRRLQDRPPVSRTKPRKAGIRILGYNGRSGFTGTLTVDWIPLSINNTSALSDSGRLQPYSWLSHSDCLLLVRDRVIEGAFDDALYLAEEKKWLPAKGWIRWHISVDNDDSAEALGHGQLLAIEGNSLGGALAVALRSLAAPGTTIKTTIALSAALRERGDTGVPSGNLYAVGRIQAKLNAALEMDTHPSIAGVVISAKQPVSSLVGNNVIKAATVEEAYKLLQMPDENPHKRYLKVSVKSLDWREQNLHLSLEITREDALSGGTCVLSVNGSPIELAVSGGVIANQTYRLIRAAPAQGEQPRGDIYVVYYIVPK